MTYHSRVQRMGVLGACTGCLALGLAGVSAPEVLAQTSRLAIDFDAWHWGERQYTFISPGGGVDIGWSFVAKSDLYVASLAFSDVGGDGLEASHAVWICDGSSSTIIGATIPAGTVASVIDGVYEHPVHWRYVPVEPTLLTAGTEYTIYAHLDPAGFSSYDVFYFWPQEYLPPSFFSRINTIDPRIGEIAGSHPYPFPEIEVGPNFFIGSVPEPSAMILLASGVAGLLFVAWRRRDRLGRR